MADTEEEAEKKYREFAELIPIENAVTYLARFFDDYDLSVYRWMSHFPILAMWERMRFKAQQTD